MVFEHHVTVNTQQSYVRCCSVSAVGKQRNYIANLKICTRLKLKLVQDEVDDAVKQGFSIICNGSH